MVIILHFFRIFPSKSSSLYSGTVAVSFLPISWQFLFFFNKFIFSFSLSWNPFLFCFPLRSLSVLDHFFVFNSIFFKVWNFSFPLKTLYEIFFLYLSSASLYNFTFLFFDPASSSFQICQPLILWNLRFCLAFLSSNSFELLSFYSDLKTFSVFYLRHSFESNRWFLNFLFLIL